MRWGNWAILHVFAISLLCHQLDSCWSSLQKGVWWLVTTNLYLLPGKVGMEWLQWVLCQKQTWKVTDSQKHCPKSSPKWSPLIATLIYNVEVEPTQRLQIPASCAPSWFKQRGFGSRWSTACQNLWTTLNFLLLLLFFKSTSLGTYSVQWAAICSIEGKLGVILRLLASHTHDLRLSKMPMSPKYALCSKCRTLATLPSFVPIWILHVKLFMTCSEYTQLLYGCLANWALSSEKL